VPNTDGKGNRTVAGVEKRSTTHAGISNPDDQEQLEGAPSFSSAGAMPGHSIMNNWGTASPDADATKPETMPNTRSTPLPGETEVRRSV
jgi:hypothetical protein